MEKEKKAEAKAKTLLKIEHFNDITTRFNSTVASFVPYTVFDNFVNSKSVFARIAVVSIESTIVSVCNFIDDDPRSTSVYNFIKEAADDHTNSFFNIDKVVRFKILQDLEILRGSTEIKDLKQIRNQHIAHLKSSELGASTYNRYIMIVTIVFIKLRLLLLKMAEATKNGEENLILAKKGFEAQQRITISLIDECIELGNNSHHTVEEYKNFNSVSNNKRFKGLYEAHEYIFTKNEKECNQYIKELKEEAGGLKAEDNQQE